MHGINILREVLFQSVAFDIIWIACDVTEAIQKGLITRPDLLLMDINLLGEEGSQIDRIMKESPCAILITTDNLVSNASKVYEAMGLGALDVVQTPFLDAEGKLMLVNDFLKKIDNFKTLLGKRDIWGRKELRHLKELPRDEKRELPALVLIGASTGGPFALSKILSSLPKPIKSAIIIIQHVDQQFAGGLATWLQERTGLNVELAEEGSKPETGLVLVAGTNDHLIMTKDHKLKYTPHPIDIPYRPSVDVFFKSIVKHWPDPSTAILLTGMGKDGAQGMKQLSDAGWYTVAEHEDSCVVYGMPKAAIELGAVKQVVPLDEIANAISNFIHSKVTANPWSKK